MDEQRKLMEAMDDIAHAIDDMRGAEDVLSDFLKRHKEDEGLYDDENGKGERYRTIKAIYLSIVDVMGCEDEVGIILDDLSEELDGGR
jgi:hypothetical protein